MLECINFLFKIDMEIYLSVPLFAFVPVLVRTRALVVHLSNANVMLETIETKVLLA
jgi:hypothetical protein